MRAGIIATGSAVPDRIIDNEQVASWPGIDTSAEWIETRTGIHTRRFANDNETTSDYAVKAAQKALANAGLEATAIDLIIVATTTPDYHCPATAVTVQHLLGAKCPAMDIKAGCSGFGYALSSANAYVISGMYQKVLVVGVDLLSRITNFKDRSTCILLGDAAGAVMVSTVADDLGMESFEMGSDGSQADKLIIPAGGAAKGLTAEGITAGEDKLYMAGQDVFKFATRIMPETINSLVAKAGVTTDDIDLIVPHQANLRIIESAAKRLDLPMSMFFVNVDRFGNTSAASIPLALDECIERGLIIRGERIVTVAFGAGLTWAGCSMIWAY